MTEIIASVMPRTGAELRPLRDLGAGHVDLFEVRADRWKESGDDLAIAIAQMGLPTIATVRPKWQGGEFAGTEVERITLLRSAARTASHVDVEMRSAFATMAFAPAKKIISTHDFEGTPDDLERMVDELRHVAPDAAIVKLATTPRDLAEVGRLVQLQRANAAGSPPLVVVGMGELGEATRLLAGKLGASFAYGRLHDAEATAPGQPDVRDLAELYRVREQSAATAVSAVVGNPIAHSLGPRLHNVLLRRHGLDRVFIPLLATRLDEALALADAIGIDGLSVTLPFKQDAARAAIGALPGFPWPPPEGAVNTLKRTANGSGWLAANTDRAGFLAALDRRAPDVLARGKSALVLGAGGAARTCVAALRDRGLAVTVASRTHAKAVELARALGATALPWNALAPDRFDLVVNATPVGMNPGVDASPLAEGALRKEQVVFDLVYRPRRTRLLEQAQRAGARPVEGLEMFVVQALAQFELFTGRAGDTELARSMIDPLLA